MVLAAASAIAGRTFPLELLVHFWPQLGSLLLVCGVITTRLGHPRLGAVEGLLGLALLCAVGLEVRRASAPTARGEPGLRAVFANVASWNGEHDRLIEVVERVGPDVVGLVEVDGAWIEALAPLRDRYPHAVMAPRDDDYGIALFSRLPVRDEKIESLTSNRLPVARATIETPAGPWRLTVAHPVPPFHRAAFRSRNRAFGEIAAWIAGDSLPNVLLADLNATLWSPYVRDLRRVAELASATAGFRQLYTWPVGFPPVALGLDHCLHTVELAAVESRVLEGIGSDHFPVYCAFTVR